MTDQAGTVPELDTADRMRVSLRHAGIGVGEMAGYFGVTAHTIGAWINGRNRPTVQTLRLWSLRTGVPYEWLCAIRDSNPEPADLEHHPRLSLVTALRQSRKAIRDSRNTAHTTRRVAGDAA